MTSARLEDLVPPKGLETLQWLGKRNALAARLEQLHKLSASRKTKVLAGTEEGIRTRIASLEGKLLDLVGQQSVDWQILKRYRTQSSIQEAVYSPRCREQVILGKAIKERDAYTAQYLKKSDIMKTVLQENGERRKRLQGDQRPSSVLSSSLDIEFQLELLGANEALQRQVDAKDCAAFRPSEGEQELLKRNFENICALRRKRNALANILMAIIIESNVDWSKNETYCKYIESVDDIWLQDVLDIINPAEMCAV
ncbi:hypothetical protein DFS34DRAFT_632230 [Phlyctochytrium arcticum]|nr:hypothetical protein DFS34DRAFT_632230 [Phlyctochytrium arcticum]